MSRSNTLTTKIDRLTTGLNGAVFVHCDHTGGRITAVRISSKYKDESLGQVFRAVGDTITDIAELLQGGEDEQVQE